MIVVPDEGELLMLRYITNNAPATDLTLRLFINNLVPDENTTIGLLTECNTPGYSPIVLSGGSWTFALNNNIAEASYPAQVFTMTGPVSAYGYYLTKGTSNIVWLERFPTAPFILPISGGTITITPRVTLD